MHELRKTGKVGFEDLMRELASLEKSALSYDASLAMSLMVIEAKIRERFQQLEYRVIQADPTYHKNSPAFSEELTLEEIEQLIPSELPPFPTFEQVEQKTKKKKIWETVFTAALLAVFTALGVFGLASLLHLALSLLA
ncbi:hypothetical protein BVX98_06685 [bacterium F11]|nr:hypothetical protein BVX98_06685 [bacterium F11]